MNGRYLLDTNIIIAIFASDRDVIHRLDAAQELFVPSIVLGELYYGARNSLQIGANLARIEMFRGASVVLACDAATAAIYGEIKAELKQTGTPIPENDIWIASIARQQNLTIVSRDKHFSSVKNILSEIW